MRPTDEMKRLVRAEAAKRRARRRVVLAGGAVASVLLVFGLVAARPDDRPAALSTAADHESRPNGRRSTDRVESGTTVPPIPVAPSAPVVEGELSPSTTTGAGPSPTVRPTTTAPGPTVGSPPSSPPLGPVVTAPGPTSAPTTTPAQTTTTVAGPRTCGAEDILTTALDVAIVDDHDDEGGNGGTDIPAGGYAELGYSTVVRPEVAACWTPDTARRITVTDLSNRVVFRWWTDVGERRLVEPGTWITYQAVVAWDPSCRPTAVPPGVTRTCEIASPGSYLVTVYDQGASLGPVALQVLP